VSKRIVLSADSTCDLGDQLRQKYSVEYYPFKILLDDKVYSDGVDLTPDRIYEIYNEKKILPKTSAINTMEYIDFFRKWTDQGYEVIHVTLGSGLSTAYNNCRLAAEELPGVYVIDSRNLSTGSGHIVIQAAERIAAGMPAVQIAKEVQDLTSKVHASFVIDTLEFLYKGGRCSALQMLGANMLQLKPCIQVNNADGTMGVGKKYRGTLDKVLYNYVHDILDNRTDLRDDRIFITHSGISQSRIDLVHDEIEKMNYFKDIYVTRAGCTITSHCGPNTLGVLFMTK
jgi:DegV family protein with EDD domain